jgi:hypothetical protein
MTSQSEIPDEIRQLITELLNRTASKETALPALIPRATHAVTHIAA